MSALCHLEIRFPTKEGHQDRELCGFNTTCYFCWFVCLFFVYLLFLRGKKSKSGKETTIYIGQHVPLRYIQLRESRRKG